MGGQPYPTRDKKQHIHLVKYTTICSSDITTTNLKVNQTLDPTPSVAQYQHKASNAAGLSRT